MAASLTFAGSVALMSVVQMAMDLCKLRTLQCRTHLTWRCSDPRIQQFYTNRTLIDDFKRYIKKLITHVNPHTGISYAEDATVFAYETGNELSGPVFRDMNIPNEWTTEIAVSDACRNQDYKNLTIRSASSNHLHQRNSSWTEPTASTKATSTSPKSTSSLTTSTLPTPPSSRRASSSFAPQTGLTWRASMTGRAILKLPVRWRNSLAGLRSSRKMQSRRSWDRSFGRCLCIMFRIASIL